MEGFSIWVDFILLYWNDSILIKFELPFQILSISQLPCFALVGNGGEKTAVVLSEPGWQHIH